MSPDRHLLRARFLLPTLAGIGLLAGLALLAPNPVHAHALDPSLLELVETGNGRVEVTWRTPVAVLPGLSPPMPVLPCVPTTLDGGAASSDRPDPGLVGLPSSLAGLATSTITDDGRSWIHRWRLDCRNSAEDPEQEPSAALAGREIAVEGLGPRSAPVLVRWLGPDGSAAEQAVLRAEAPRLHLPEEPSRGRIAWSYSGLGIEHILTGFDHLAFVFALTLWVLGRGHGTPARRRWHWLFRTLTAFTVGHSLTLALVVFDLLRLPSAAVEIAIAASILVLAVELAATRGEPSAPDDSPGRERALRPWWLAGAFGLLHGCGFAGALREMGLPEGDVPAALFAFNLGIELGQVLFVGVLGLLAWAASGIAGHDRARQRLETVAIYALGTLSAYWTLGRLFDALG